jgi:hypothetical protein
MIIHFSYLTIHFRISDSCGCYIIMINQSISLMQKARDFNKGELKMIIKRLSELLDKKEMMMEKKLTGQNFIRGISIAVAVGFAVGIILEHRSSKRKCDRLKSQALDSVILFKLNDKDKYRFERIE